MIISTIPTRPKAEGSGFPSRIIPPIKAKMISLAWVESTPATSLEVTACSRAYKNRLVAATPDNKATSSVLNTCALPGNSGRTMMPKTSQNGKLPTVINHTLLKAFCNRSVSITGIRLIRVCSVELFAVSRSALCVSVALWALANSAVSARIGCEWCSLS